VWLSTPIEEDPAGRAMLQAGVSRALLDAWCSNAVCEIDGKTDKAYDLLEDIDTSEAIRLALGSTVAASTTPSEVVFVLGGPGAGKGTQCAKIVEEFGWMHLSAGDLLRAERATGSENAQLINNYITEGKIVPVEITIKLILAEMEKNVGKKFLVDGFPRSEDNRSGWYEIAGDKAVVSFACSMTALRKSWKRACWNVVKQAEGLMTT